MGIKDDLRQTDSYGIYTVAAPIDSDEEHEESVV